MTTQFLPRACATGIVLGPEPISNWADDCDLRRLLSEGVLLGSPGDHYAVSLFQEGRERLIALAKEFREHALLHPDSMANVQDEVPNFEEDMSFGWMAKHAVAFDGILNAMLSDGAFVSLPHILETDSDLECSRLLASRMYYKQAFQSLRGVIELSVAQVHFTAHPADFHSWVQGAWRLPTMRGSRGWLATLKAEGALTGNVDEETAELYGVLNGTVHASETRLVHSGLPRGRWSGLQFKREQFDDWCTCYGRAVSICLRLLAQMLANDLAAPKPDGIVCPTCRQINNFDVVSRGDSSVTLKCRTCFNEQGFALAHAQKHGY